MAAGADEKAAAGASPAGGSGGGGSKIVLILSLVNLVATLGMVALLFISFQKEKHASVEDLAVKAASEGEGEKPKEGEKKGESKGEGKEGGHEGKEGEKKKSANFGKMVTLEKFTVNLSTPGSSSSRYVLVNISLEVPNDDVEGEVTAKVPQVRNVIIDLFNSKRPSDLATADGREYLKEEIKNALNSFLLTGKIKGVFFTSFALSG
jgi:flagellar FliL protein